MAETSETSTSRGETIAADQLITPKMRAAAKKAVRIDVLLEEAAEYLPLDECQLIKQAYTFAAQAHDGQFRKTGEPFIMHPVEVAIIVAELHMDSDTIQAALLHDTIEDSEDVTREDIEELFGETVALLVDGVTKITKLEIESLSELQVGTLRKMLVAMSEDLRVIVIKLADRLHNMRTLMALREDRRIFKAKETMEIYAPLAHRLGMNAICWELEDLSFFYLEPDKYQQVQKMVNETREAREEYLDQVIDVLRTELDDLGIEATIYGRPKHLYSIYQKMTTKGKDFSEIYDLIALRVIVDTVKDCYNVLGVAHSLWHPMPGRFKDYIAMPKFNMYQSLHTTVIGPAGRPLEIQIRTVEMHRMDEYGIAAHYRYKEGESKQKSNEKFDRELSWLTEMLNWQEETDDPQEFMDSLRGDLFENEVYVFTPKGDVIALRAQATPLDFAYAIHTEVGHHCVGAKVNGEIVPLTYTLQMGDRVEILTQKSQSPSRDWLNIVKTPSARSKIRSYFAKASRKDDLEHGRDLLMREVRKNGLGMSASTTTQALEDVAKDFNYADTDEMMVAIGAGKISALQVTNRLLRVLNKDAAEAEEREAALEEMELSTGEKITPHQGRHRSQNETGIVVKGIDDVFVRLSRCCNPVPGDEIIGFVTRGRGVSVHRADCPNASDLKRNPERMIEVAWEDTANASFQVEVMIEAIDRLRLLQDVTAFLADQGVNIISCQTITHKDEIVEMRYLFEVSDTDRIGEILRDVLTVEGVFGARRILPNKASEEKVTKS